MTTARRSAAARRRGSRGVVLFAALVAIAVLLAFGGTVFSLVLTESRVTRSQRDYLKALHIAEAGFERTLRDLRLDLTGAGGAPSWADGDINGMACGPDDEEFYPLPYLATAVGDGSYVAFLKNVQGMSDHVWIRSVGSVGPQQMGVETYVTIYDLAPWRNAVFAGRGMGSEAVSGKSVIAGSVHILGDGLTDADYAISLGGAASIMNNYAAMPAELKARIPSCPTVEHEGEMVESLGAVIRVKRGRIGLSGGSEIGSASASGNGVKETADAVYSTALYGGSGGAGHVHSDNGAAALYDAGNAVEFPRVTDPYDTYDSYMEYLEDNALVITSSAELSELASITPASSFSYTDVMGRGSIGMDGNGHMTVEGVVYVKGDFNTFPHAYTEEVDTDGDGILETVAGTDETITYSGKGTIVIEGDATIETDLVTDAFPSSTLGLMTPNTISFTGAEIDVMGAFYGQTKIVVAKKTDVAGSLVSEVVDMGTNVPRVFHVPAGAQSLPPLIIRPHHLTTRVVAWKTFRP